jgi:hypothetical protein
MRQEKDFAWASGNSGLIEIRLGRNGVTLILSWLMTGRSGDPDHEPTGTV